MPKLQLGHALVPEALLRRRTLPPRIRTATAAARPAATRARSGDVTGGEMPLFIKRRAFTLASCPFLPHEAQLRRHARSQAGAWERVNRRNDRGWHGADRQSHRHQVAPQHPLHASSRPDEAELRGQARSQAGAWERVNAAPGTRRKASARTSRSLRFRST